MNSMKRPGMNFSLEVSTYVLNYLVYLKFWEPQYMHEIQGNLKTKTVSIEQAVQLFQLPNSNSSSTKIL